MSQKLYSGNHFFPDFDAFRWIAFLLVFFQHGFVSFDNHIIENEYYKIFLAVKSNGHIGIDMFFVLSSFLITYKILEEYNTRHSFSLKNFIVRRSLRIWPLYFGLIAAGFLSAFIYQNITGNMLNLPPVEWLLTFTANYHYAFHGTQYLFFMVFLWSIAVEEQFYIFWAFLLRYAKNILIPFCVFTFIFSSLYVWQFSQQKNHNLYFDTLNYLPLFGAGALFAYTGIKKNRLSVKMANMSKPYIIAIYALAACFIIFNQYLLKNQLLSIFNKTITGLLFGFILFEQSYGRNSLFKLREMTTASYLGKISYGLYCFHGVSLTVFLHQQLPINAWIRDLMVIPALSLSLTILLSHYSYRYFETPFLKLKSRF